MLLWKLYSTFEFGVYIDFNSTLFPKRRQTQKLSPPKLVHASHNQASESRQAGVKYINLKLYMII